MINFFKYKTIFFAISLLFIIPSVFFLLRFGLKPSIDFTGGTLIEITITPQDQSTISIDQLKSLIGSEFTFPSIQSTGNNTFIFRGPSISHQQNLNFQSRLKSLGKVDEKRFESVGPTLGKELLKKTFFGIVLASGFILAFVAYSFKDKKYGVCAVLAMLHDSLIMLGAFSALGYFFGIEVDALFVTALLTILSFSVHDTIVVYDRIRETLRLNPKLNFTDTVNQAVTETLGRSVNNSLTIIFMLLSLFLLGGETIKWFILALLIGTVSGTYSSTFTAAPLLVLWEELKHKKLKKPAQRI